MSRWTTKEVMDWLTSNDLHPVAGRSVAYLCFNLFEEILFTCLCVSARFYDVLRLWIKSTRTELEQSMNLVEILMISERLVILI